MRGTYGEVVAVAQEEELVLWEVLQRVTVPAALPAALFRLVVLNSAMLRSAE